jgi:hypothetical protein
VKKGDVAGKKYGTSGRVVKGRHEVEIVGG